MTSKLTVLCFFTTICFYFFLVTVRFLFRFFFPFFLFFRSFLRFLVVFVVAVAVASAAVVFVTSHLFFTVS